MSNQIIQIKKYANSPEVIERFQAILGEHEARPYVESVILAVTGDESGRLQACDPASIMHSALRAATLHLSVDKAVHEAHLVAFGNKATLIPDYRGLVKLLEDTGRYKHINVSAVYAGEIVKKNRITGEVEITGEQTGDEIIGWLAYFQKTNGVEKFNYMTTEECLAHGRKYSKGFNSGAWKSDPDKMCRKTALRMLCNQWGEFSPVVAQVLKEDDEVIDAELEEMPEVASVTAQDVIEYGNSAEKSSEQAKIDAGYEAMSAAEKDYYDQKKMIENFSMMFPNADFSSEKAKLLQLEKKVQDEKKDPLQPELLPQ